MGPQPSDQCPCEQRRDTETEEEVIARRQRQRSEGCIWKPGGSRTTSHLQNLDQPGWVLPGAPGGLAQRTPGYQTSSLRARARPHLCGFKPPTLWSFVAAAPGNAVPLKRLNQSTLLPAAMESSRRPSVYPPPTHTECCPCLKKKRLCLFWNNLIIEKFQR